MMLKSFGLYLLEKRYHAVWVALLCAFLPFLYLPTFSLAVLIIALVTLHKGIREGFIVLGWVMLPGIAASFYGDFNTLFVDDVGKAIAVWLMAGALGYTARWVTTLQAAVAGGMLTVIAVHLMVPDINDWWFRHLAPYGSQIQLAWNLSISPEQLKAVFMKVASFATGTVVAGLLALDTVFLLMARGWQGVLFNPGGMAQEWRQLRLTPVYSSALLLILIGAWLGASWLTDLLPVVLMPFIFAGLSLVHAKLWQKKTVRMPALIALYSSMLFFSPYVCMALAVVAFVDSWYDLRSLGAKPDRQNL